MRRSSAIALALACTAILGWVAYALADPPTGTVTSYAIPAGASGPSGPTGPTGAAGATALTPGPDGNPWFVETRDPNGGFRVGTVAAGKVVEYPSPPLTLRPAGMAAAGGELWFTDGNSDIGELYSLSTAGVTTPVTRVLPSLGLAADASGDLWLAHPQYDEIGEVATEPPAIETFPGRGDAGQLPASADPEYIAAGPDGTTMWFTEPGIEEVGSITAAGVVTQYPLPSNVSGTLGNIVLGPDGDLWVGVADSAVDGPPQLDGSLRLGLAAVARSQPALVRITPAGDVTAFPVPSGYDADPDV
ncbi:MAG: hypothetical protein ABSF58_06815, partial [Solirubrobacteraceae bacterium]